MQGYLEIKLIYVNNSYSFSQMLYLKLDYIIFA